MINDIQPTAPLLILAIRDDDVDNVLPEELFANSFKEIYNLENPTEHERKEFFTPIFTAATENVSQPPAPEEEEILDELPVIPVHNIRELTEKEETKLRKKEESRLRELRIFLAIFTTK